MNARVFQKSILLEIKIYLKQKNWTEIPYNNFSLFTFYLDTRHNLIITHGKNTYEEKLEIGSETRPVKTKRIKSKRWRNSPFKIDVEAGYPKTPAKAAEKTRYTIGVIFLTLSIRSCDYVLLITWVSIFTFLKTSFPV